MKRFIFIIIMLTAFFIRSSAQGCSVCTQTTSGMGNESAQGLNNGIIYLAAIPLVFLLTVGIIWYRKNKHTI